MVTTCAVVQRLDQIARLPLTLPEAVGVNVTVKVQLAPYATHVPQLLVAA